jgi:hypothetical protein
MIMKFNRYYTERAEVYFINEYLDYTDNDWYDRGHFVRVLIPIVEMLLQSNLRLQSQDSVIPK